MKKKSGSKLVRQMGRRTCKKMGLKPTKGNVAYVLKEIEKLHANA